MMPREMRFAHFTRHHSIRVQKRSCEISPFVSIHIKRTVVCFWADSSKICNFLAGKTLLLGERENSGNKSTERLDKRYIRQLIFSMSFFLFTAIYMRIFLERGWNGTFHTEAAAPGSPGATFCYGDSGLVAVAPDLASAAGDR